MNSTRQDQVLSEYYERRAPLMDRHYADSPPGWVLEMVADLQTTLRGRRVLEIACGTGYWTRFASEAAEYILGIDTAPTMLALAQQRGLSPQKAGFCAGDAYALDSVPGVFNAGLAMQWFSHVPRARHASFLNSLHKRIGVGAAVFLGDNQFQDSWADADKPYAKPGEPDTYELRALPDGSHYEIVKNYFSADDLHSILAPHATDLTIHMGTYWWWLHYTAA
jgi:SAM-dependent methyltransferase